MLKASIKRTQYAVGHGGFHTGNIAIFDQSTDNGPVPSEKLVKNFWYVYDCGSEETASLTDALTGHRRACDGHTHLLFVSHLHSDHINGIERLQAMAPAKTVVVPYLDVVERLIFVLSDIDAGSITSSALEYFRNPVGWWQNRGATRIIFLQPGGGDDVPPIWPGTPDTPIDGTEPDRGDLASHEGRTPAGRVAAHLRKPNGPIPDGLISADSTQRDIADGAALAGAGSAFQLEWRADIGDSWKAGDWILLPYVHPEDKTARSKFRSAVKRALKLRSSDDEKFTKRLVDHLASYEKTKILLDLYGEHFTHNHNALSMSLYSGPFRSSSRRPARPNGWDRTWEADFEDISPLPLYFYVRYPAEPVGWLGAGDAALRQAARRDPWLSFFRPYMPDIGILTLPHHGSAHNFHEDMLVFNNLKIALATTVERRQRVARMRETLSAIEAKQIPTWVVDDVHRNTFGFRCTRAIFT